MDTNKEDADRLISFGYSYEYPGFWAKNMDQDFTVTVSDGQNDEGFWCVQIMNGGDFEGGFLYTSLDDVLRNH